MAEKTKKKIYLYTRFERFWHWLQTLLIVMLLFTGFEVHGSFALLGFERAVELHNLFGVSWLILFTFIVFWVLTTGEWRQYIPTTKKLLAVIAYYSWGIFKGRPHPVQKSPGAKHNPLQRLTYLGLTATLLPVQMVTGLLYWGYNDWPAWLAGGIGLPLVALVHLALAFVLVSFLIVHVYMTTTGHGVFSHIAAMISGWEEVYESTEIQDWERADKRKA